MFIDQFRAHELQYRLRGQDLGKHRVKKQDIPEDKSSLMYLMLSGSLWQNTEGLRISGKGEQDPR